MASGAARAATMHHQQPHPVFLCYRARGVGCQRWPLRRQGKRQSKHLARPPHASARVACKILRGAGATFAHASIIGRSDASDVNDGAFRVLQKSSQYSRALTGRVDVVADAG